MRSLVRTAMASQLAGKRAKSIRWDPASTRFEDVVTAFQRELFATAIRIVGERTLAEDTLQDTFLKAYRALDSLAPGSNLRAWLYRILVNTAYDQLDRQKTRAKVIDNLREQERPTSPADRPPADGLDRENVVGQVEEAIRSLPEKYRDPLILRHIQGLSYAEVGEALDMPEATARTLVFRGKRMLLPKLKHLME